MFRVDRPEKRKKIPGYGDRYEVSDLGRVYSGEFELSAVAGRYVYLSAGGKVERVAVSYLVARAFLGNPEMRPYVRHKNGDVKDNRVENLEWVEWKERCGAGSGRREVKQAVMVYDVETGEFVGKWESVKKASEDLGVARNLIARCARGEARRAKGYVFRYV